MSNAFDDFDLDIQRISADGEDDNAEPKGTTTTTVGIRSIFYSCEWLGCVEVGKTSDLCNTDNCSQLTQCADCY